MESLSHDLSRDDSADVSRASVPPVSEVRSTPVQLQKPLLRGVSHQVFFFVAIVAIALLVSRVHTQAAITAVLVFGASLVGLLGTSACYHRINWTPVARQRMRRMDHAAIFMLIGGGYTPLFALVESEGGGHGALAAIWIGAGVGIVKSLAWPHAPKWLTAMLCVAIGWMVIFQVMGRTPIVGATCVGLHVASGVTYSVGAVVYALKRPDPWPRVFGYHEIFHLLVVLASGFLFAHVCYVVAAVAS
ncbi:MAG: putative rane protein hemolysin [Labilithrix sp.]|nr:putative rane protein hemolysin [Labilithrix sp.]